MATVASVGNVMSAEIDLFSLPHKKMRQLIITSAENVLSTDFTDTVSVEKLLNQLSSALLDFRNHEEIEDKCIMRSLKRRLSGAMLRKLVKHLHADNHIADMIDFINTVQEKIKMVKSSEDLEVHGKQLHDAFETFSNDYLPHMMREEKVFQPLLKQHFSEHELQTIKQRVLDLHAIHCSKDLFSEYQEHTVVFSKVSLTDKEILTTSTKEHTDEHIQDISLPSEVLLKIFGYLQPKELCSCAQVCKSWSVVAVDGSLWETLHPARWARGNWTFGTRGSSDDCNCDCEPNYDLQAFRESPVEGSEEGSTTSGSDTDGEEDLRFIKRETRILVGINHHLLPKIGSLVKTLVLECSKAITNGLVYRMLSQCPKLEYLDISQTIISDLGLKGLFKDGGGRYLQYLDVSGCVGITDKTLSKLSSALGKIPIVENKNISCDSSFKCKESKPCSKAVCDCFPSESTERTSSFNTDDSQMIFIRQLRCLRVSGCYKITDSGLRSLARHGGLPHLKHLDLSGCLNITVDGIRDIVLASPNLDHSELYYCDNIMDETAFSGTASGCQNLDCKNRFCCRTGRL